MVYQRKLAVALSCGLDEQLNWALGVLTILTYDTNMVLKTNGQLLEALLRCLVPEQPYTEDDQEVFPTTTLLPLEDQFDSPKSSPINHNNISNNLYHTSQANGLNSSSSAGKKSNKRPHYLLTTGGVFGYPDAEAEVDPSLSVFHDQNLFNLPASHNQELYCRPEKDDVSEPERKKQKTRKNQPSEPPTVYSTGSSVRIRRQVSKILYNLSFIDENKPIMAGHNGFIEILAQVLVEECPLAGLHHGQGVYRQLIPGAQEEESMAMQGLHPERQELIRQGQAKGVAGKERGFLHGAGDSEVFENLLHTLAQIAQSLHLSHRWSSLRCLGPILDALHSEDISLVETALDFFIKLSEGVSFQEKTSV